MYLRGCGRGQRKHSTILYIQFIQYSAVCTPARCEMRMKLSIKRKKNTDENYQDSHAVRSKAQTAQETIFHRK